MKYSKKNSAVVSSGSNLNMKLNFEIFHLLVTSFLLVISKITVTEEENREEGADGGGVRTV